MMTVVHKSFGILLLFCLCLTACKLDDFQDVEGIDYEAEFAIPLINSSVTIQDLLDQSDEDLTFLTIEEDGSFTLAYEDKAEAISGEEVMAEFPAAFPIPITDHQVNYSLNNLNGISLESANFKSGTISIEMTSSVPEDLDVKVTFPGIIKDNQALTFNTTLRYQGNTPVQASIAAVSLEGYQILASNGNLEVTYDAMNAGGVNRQLDIVLAMAENWQFSTLQGRWQNLDIPMEEDTVNLDIYDNLVSGELHFTDPRLQIIIDNSFGLPVLIQMETIEVVTQSGEVIPMESGILEEGFLIDAPESGQLGAVVQSTFTLNRNNSNIETIFNAEPKEVLYRVRLKVAPGNQSTAFFILDDSKVDVKVVFELPIYGTAKNFTLESEIAIDLGEENSQNIKEAQLKVITSNALPVEAGIQLYFVDPFDQKIDSVFSEVQEVVAANGPPVTSYIDISPARLDRLRQSNKILIQSVLSTSNQGNTPVRIYNDQELGIKLGLRTTLQE